MELDIESYLYRIINGYYTLCINNTTYKIILPTLKEKNDAYQVYLSVIEDNKFDTKSWITKQVTDNLLKVYNIWNEKKEEGLKLSYKNLDNLKIQLYLNFDNLSLRNNLKKQIQKLFHEINVLINKKHYFDYLTLEHYAENIKNQYLITNMIYNIDGSKVFKYDNFENVNFLLLEKFLLEIHNHTINTDTIKKISRNYMWKSFWNISKEQIFAKPIQEWTDEQQSLVNFTKVLDSVREHLDAPSSEVMEDDDALDGWILYQNDKNEKEKKKKHISDKYGLDKKQGDEVFIMTNDQNESNAIFDLNDANTKRDIATARKIIQEKGNVKEVDLPHVQRKLKEKLRNNRNNI